MRDGHAAGVPLKRLNDFETGLDTRAEVVGAPGQICLVEIVGLDTSQQKLVHETFHDLRVVVDAFQQHGLRTQRDANVGKTTTGLFNFRGELVGMVEV